MHAIESMRTLPDGGVRMFQDQKSGSGFIPVAFLIISSTNSYVESRFN